MFPMGWSPLRHLCLCGISSKFAWFHRQIFLPTIQLSWCRSTSCAEFPLVWCQFFSSVGATLSNHCKIQGLFELIDGNKWFQMSLTVVSLLFSGISAFALNPIDWETLLVMIVEDSLFCPHISQNMDSFSSSPRWLLLLLDSLTSWLFAYRCFVNSLQPI